MLPPEPLGQASARRHGSNRVAHRNAARGNGSRQPGDLARLLPQDARPGPAVTARARTAEEDVGAMGYEIRTMSRAELGLALDWAAAEGWNPGLDDATPFHVADPAGFL